MPRPSSTRGQPTLILPKTVKGYGMGESGEGQMIAHQAKKMTQDALRGFRDRFQIPVSDADLDKVPFVKLSEDSAEMKYLRARREALGGYLPLRRRKSSALTIPPLSTFQRLLDSSGEREISTTMAFVQMLGTLVRDKVIGKHVVPIVPDESRTFGMEGMFRQLGIYSSVGQLYKPQDADQLMYYRESKDGQVLQEGINEGGAMSSWIVAATSYSTNNVPMIPFYIYYSMFGLQRVGDLAWLAGDIRARGFLLGGTAGRTTLNGEGLQHEDGHSHILAGTIPNCVSYDPTFAYEVVTIIRDGMRRMYEDQEDVYYYVTLMNENYPHPGMAAAGEGVEQGILKGLYKLQDGGKTAKKGLRVQLMGSGTILREVIAAARAAEGRLRRRRRRLERDQLQRAAPRRHGDRALEPAAPDRDASQELGRELPRRPRGPGGRIDRLHAQLRRPGARIRAAGRPALRRARHRRIRPQRLPRQAAPLLRGRSPLRRGGGAEGARRRRRDQARGRRRGDREVRAGHRARRAVDRLTRAGR